MNLKWLALLSASPCWNNRRKVKIKDCNILIDIHRDFVEISHLTYRELDELKVVMQPVKIILRLDPFETQIER